MTEPIFRGVATAIITPFTSDGTKVDWDAFGRIIEWQIAEGINGLVIAGTTGEGPTLTDEEHREVFRFALEVSKHRVPMIAGTGSNDTAYCISLTELASDLGYDGMLVVTPYYNKATQNGLVKMYTDIAAHSKAPLVLYNVPSRTGVNIEPATYAALADNPMIGAIKEANGNIGKIVQTRALVGDRLTLYSGNDDQIVPIMAMGGQGVISVLSNVAPRQTVEICNRMFAGDVEGAAKLQCDWLPLINALFSEVNPIPVKAAMAAMGWCNNVLRSPLYPMEPAHEEHLLECMKERGLI